MIDIARTFVDHHPPFFYASKFLLLLFVLFVGLECFVIGARRLLPQMHFEPRNKSASAEQKVPNQRARPQSDIPSFIMLGSSVTALFYAFYLYEMMIDNLELTFDVLLFFFNTFAVVAISIVLVFREALLDHRDVFWRLCSLLAVSSTLLIFIGFNFVALFFKISILNLVMRTFYVPIWFPMIIFMMLDLFCQINIKETRNKLLLLSTLNSSGNEKSRSTARRLYWFCVVKVGSSVPAIFVIIALVVSEIFCSDPSYAWFIWNYLLIIVDATMIVQLCSFQLVIWPSIEKFKFHRMCITGGRHKNRIAAGVVRPITNGYLYH